MAVNYFLSTFLLLSNGLSLKTMKVQHRFLTEGFASKIQENSDRMYFHAFLLLTVSL